MCESATPLPISDDVSVPDLLSYPDPHPDTTHQWADCPRTEELLAFAAWKEPNAFELLYSQEMSDLLRKSEVVLLFHCNEFTHYPKHAVSYFDIYIIHA